jgi:hypothetical protein
MNDSLSQSPRCRDPAVHDVKEAAAAESVRVATLEDGPVAVFEDGLDKARDVSGRESAREHHADRIAAADGAFRDLMVDGVLLVKAREGFDVRAVERVHPGLHDLAGPRGPTHRSNTARHGASTASGRRPSTSDAGPTTRSRRASSPA